MRSAERTKVCANPDCALAGVPQPWSNFWAARKWEDGTMRSPRARCKVCHQIETRKRLREKRATDRAWAKRKDTKTWQRIRQDPELSAIRREQSRQSQALLRRRRGIKPRAFKPRLLPQPGGRMLDPDSFIIWLRTLGPTPEQISPVCGVSARYIRSLLAGKEARVSTDIVDRACLRVGIRIDDLYPLEEAA